MPTFQRITVPDDADLARRGLRYMRDMGMWPNGLAIPERAIETTIDLMIQAGLRDEGTRMSAVGVFDNSYLQEALARRVGGASQSLRRKIVSLLRPKVSPPL